MKKMFLKFADKIWGNRRLDWLVLPGGLVVYAGLTLNKITASSIWFDEAFGAYMVRFNFLDIARYTATDVHPPLYYWALKLWTMLFGTSDLAFRSMSMFFGMVAIVFGFLLVKKLFGRKAAWVSLGLLIISPMLIRYGQEARMYTMAATIALAATYVLTYAVNSKGKKLWVLYGILVALGMLTHYFIALVWIAHWVWRAVVLHQNGARGKELRSKLFSGNWWMAYLVAVAVFLPWGIIALVAKGIFGAGAWVGAVGAYSIPNFLTNAFFYVEQNKALGWYGMALLFIVVAVTYAGLKAYKKLSKKEKQSYLLILSLAVVPVIALFVMSLPPLRSSFVERYMIASYVGVSLLVGVTLSLRNGLSKIWKGILAAVLVVSMLAGIGNVYFYGNYNKNNGTKVGTSTLVKRIGEISPKGEPIIAESPWIFYEAVFYNSSEHPIYFLDSSTSYEYGSLDMLKYSDDFKIKDLNQFSKDYSKIWYIGYKADGTLTPPVDSWVETQNFVYEDSVDHKTLYRASEFQVK